MEEPRNVEELSPFHRGMRLGVRVEHEAAVRAIAQAALAILGKDRADGQVDLGALGKHYAA